MNDHKHTKGNELSHNVFFSIFLKSYFHLNIYIYKIYI